MRGQLQPRPGAGGSTGYVFAALDSLRMEPRGFQVHLDAPVGRGEPVRGGHSGAAGGAACGDLVRITLAVEGDRVASASFDAHGCGAVLAAGSAALALTVGGSVLGAARVGPGQIAAELGGLHPAKRHAAELAADALARALGAAVRADARAPLAPGARPEPSSSSTRRRCRGQTTARA